MQRFGGAPVRRDGVTKKEAKKDKNGYREVAEAVIPEVPMDEAEEVPHVRAILCGSGDCSVAMLVSKACSSASEHVARLRNPSRGDSDASTYRRPQTEQMRTIVYMNL